MDNYNIRVLEDKIIDDFNASNVSIETKRLIAQNVLNLLTKEADKEICDEIKKKKSEKEPSDIQEV